jgi:transcriptional regulator with XRE-family HTH domain
MVKNKFKLARMQEGLRQVELSLKTRIPVATLSGLENGWRNPTPKQLKRLMKVLPKLKEVVAENG